MGDLLRGVLLCFGIVAGVSLFALGWRVLHADPETYERVRQKHLRGERITDNDVNKWWFK